METADDTGKDEAKPQLHTEKLKPQLHSYWNFRSVVFQVENTLFSVLKHGFIEPGTPFETMFSLPPEDLKNVEGSSDDNPIILEDTTVDDFVAFLRETSGVEKVDSHNDWMGVLRLSHKWGFIQMRTSAIKGLTPHVTKMAEHDKISLGSTFLVREWFREGLVDIVTKRDLEIGAKEWVLDTWDAFRSHVLLVTVRPK
ncbi:hypothetical protein D9619_002127 [Psilocybe cf. subviscida]|uniref:BTB domain-containing protein n=1 Tax=Psilocybe cf. subviscida TaxID=2480587 RepID=A0A8H5BFB3_9AGAR|nr:hypothetical protein D9619_002127 [Psilocybe cf. subviscida]